MRTSFMDGPLIKVCGNGALSERKVIGAHRHHHPSIQSSKLLLMPDRLDRAVASVAPSLNVILGVAVGANRWERGRVALHLRSVNLG